MTVDPSRRIRVLFEPMSDHSTPINNLKQAPNSLQSPVNILPNRHNRLGKIFLSQNDLIQQGLLFQRITSQQFEMIN